MLKALRRLFSGGKPRFRVLSGNQEFFCDADQLLLDAALRSDADISYSCQVGACGACRVRVVSGTYTTDRDLDYLLTPEELATNVTLACQTWLTSDVQLAPADSPVLTHATLEACQTLDENVVEVRLRPDEPVTYHVGQSVYLSPLGWASPRAYSMVDLGEHDPTRLVFHVKLRKGGEFSAWLARHVGKSGARLRLSRPVGHTAQTGAANSNTALCIAGGSGMGVVASLVLSRHRVTPLQRVLMLGVNRAELSGYHASIARRLTDGLGFAPTVVNAPYADWCAPNAGAPRELVEQAQDAWAVLCGSTDVLSAAQRHVASAGVRADRICSVSFVTSGTRQRWRTEATTAQESSYANP